MTTTEYFAPLQTKVDALAAEYATSSPAVSTTAGERASGDDHTADFPVVGVVASGVPRGAS